MADADLTYDFDEIPRFVEQLDDGAELVMGDRMDNIHPGAMPWLHRYVGNPVLTGILNLFFRTGVSDAHCGMRALRRDVLPRLDLRTTGMEFASEMVIRASKEKLRHRASSRSSTTRAAASRSSRASATAGATCASCSSTARRTCSSCPGAVMAVLGALIGAARAARSIDLFGRAWDLHAMIAGALLMIVGTQVVALGLVRARLRHVLHGRAATRGSTACARASGSSTACCSAAALALVGLVARRRDRRSIWIARGFGALVRGAPRGRSRRR